MKLKKWALAALCFTLLSPLRADEGMWLLPLLQQQNSAKLKELGLKLDVTDIYNPDSTSLKDAVVIFGGGCTGEIISPEGLLLTNHHCGYGAIQQHSTVEHDYLKDGFWAMNRSEELATPDLKVRFIENIEEVTDYVVEALKEEAKTDPMVMFDTQKLNELAEQKIGEEYLTNHPWIEVDIKPFYSGNKYYMFVKKVYSDIRLVGAPPSSIGKFGADTDNWMWPRHTGDFSLFRVYTAKDGTPAEYAEENVPLQPKRFFNISLKGVQENDFAMIMGFPGSTNRFYTSQEVIQRRDIANQVRIDIRGLRQDELLDEMLADPKVQIQYASKYAGSSNYWKNAIGMNKAINKLDVVAQKEIDEKAFTAWAKKNNKEEYIEALETIQELSKKSSNLYYELYMLSEALSQGVEFSRVPHNLDLLEEAIEKKSQKLLTEEMERLDKGRKRFLNKDYNPMVDARVAKVVLQAYAEAVAEENQPEIFAYIKKAYKGNYAKFVDEAFEQSIFINDKQYAKFQKRPKVSTLKNDPMVRFANAVSSKMQEINAQLAPISDEYKAATKLYTKGLLEMRQGEATYPDANFTMRLTYGNVLSYNPADAVHYNYFTTLGGVMEKEDPNSWEFVVPQRLKELYQTKDYGMYGNADGTLTCGFISNNDITGGNSGSPVINNNGELIGTAFDGNWEAMSGDIVFEPNLQRTISVDIRYTLFIIDKYAGASHLIEEMNIVR